MKKFMLVVLGVILFVLPLCACSGTGIAEVIKPTPTPDRLLTEGGRFFLDNPKGVVSAGSVRFRDGDGAPKTLFWDFIYDFSSPLDITDWEFVEFFSRQGYKWEITESDGRDFAVLTQE